MENPNSSSKPLIKQTTQTCDTPQIELYELPHSLNSGVFLVRIKTKNHER